MYAFERTQRKTVFLVACQVNFVLKKFLLLSICSAVLDYTSRRSYNYLLPLDHKYLNPVVISVHVMIKLK
jgi:hypothetical protein